MYRSRFASALAKAALAVILLPSLLHAQITFQCTYGGVGPDAGYSVRQTTDGGYITSGVIGVNVGDVYLIKTASDGETIWTRTFGGVYDDRGTSVCQTTDGGFVIGGATWSFGADSGDVYLIKTDPVGDTLWTRKYGGRSYEQGLSVQQTSDSSYVVTGTTQSFGAGLEDIYLIMADTQGDTEWTRTYGGPNYDYGQTVRQTADEGFIIAGATSSFGAGLYDFYLLKTDHDGNLLWSRTFGGDSNDLSYEVNQTADSGYVIVGYTESFGAGKRDVYLVRTDANGETLWTRTFGGAQIDEGYSVKQTDDGGYVAVGVTKSFGSGSHDVYLIRTDPNGEMLWTRTFGGASGDGGNSVQQTSDGGYIIAGATFSYGAGESDVYLIKTDSTGLAVTEPRRSPTRASALLLTCEPNPCRSSAILHLTAGPLGHSTAIVRVYDSQGRLVHLASGVRSSAFPLDLRSLPSGAYFIRCYVAGEHAAARLVLQR
ncbi:T9SS type A sorting domain-containing protein [candidate division WOR-3 bacterium]|nr:T9SS type A sorting domain-containing protein [candidate division WOR-3 bacterium]